MSLRRALTVLPDDRGTANAVREILSFFNAHPRHPIEPERLMHATGLPPARVEPVLEVLSKAYVIDCDGDPRLKPCSFDPDSVLSLEVSRYLRVADKSTARLQSRVDRFRGRYPSP